MMTFLRRQGTASLVLILLVGMLCGLGVIVAVASCSSSASQDNPEEAATRDKIAEKFHLPSDWAAIDRYVSFQYLHLGLTRDQIHARLSVIGPFDVKREEYLTDDQGRAIVYEDVAFKNEYVLKGLGLRQFKYDRQTGLLVVTLKTRLPSGEQSRLLPPR